jgi:hypothetical protein
MENITEVRWESFADRLERGISPPMSRAVTIVPKNQLSGLVIYVGVNAFNEDARVTDNDLRWLAQHIEYKLNQQEEP